MHCCVAPAKSIVALYALAALAAAAESAQAAKILSVCNRITGPAASAFQIGSTESSGEKPGYGLSSRYGGVLYPVPWRIPMKPLIFALCIMSAFGSLSAQKPVW